MNYHTFELAYKITPTENDYYTNILSVQKGKHIVIKTNMYLLSFVKH